MAAVASSPRCCVHRVLPSQFRDHHAALAASEARARLALGPIHPMSAALLTSSHWAPGRLLRVAFRGGTRAARQEWLDAAATWMKYANIRFKQVTSGPAEVRVTFEPGGSWSYIGTQILAIPGDQPTMNIGWPDDMGRTLHEIGHTLGLIHEHQNPLAKIHWNRAAVLAYYAGPPNYWPPEETIANVLEPVNPATLTNGGFDRLSIMLYAIPEELVEDKADATPWNTCLSAGDEGFIAKIYPKS
jgi:hypothetical protein